MMKDTSIREYARRYRELCGSAQQQKKREHWRDLNSFACDKPLIYVRQVPYNEFFDYSMIKSEDPLLREAETFFATAVEYQQHLNDDFIYEPWYSLWATHTRPSEMRWGVPCSLDEKPSANGAAAYHAVIRDEEDIEKLNPVARHEINEQATALRYEKLADAFGDIVDVFVNRAGLLSSMWNMDISTDLAKIRGLEQIMWDCYDRPEWLHRLLGRMQKAILDNHAQTMAARDFSLANHQNQCMPYCRELADPSPAVKGIDTRHLWGFMASQETTTFGPELFSEFMLEYQKPIMALYGLTAYGCCEDLTHKIPLLKQIPNLRRIAVTPWANLEQCAAQIGGDYVISYRPNPSDMIATGLDEEHIRKTMRNAFAIFKHYGCVFDITLKDVQTISGKPQNLLRWTDIVREEIERAF